MDSPFQASLLSPYLDFDPKVLQQGDPYIYPDSNTKMRGRFELSFSQIGGAVMAGGAFGSGVGVLTGLRETRAQNLSKALWRTQMLNFQAKSIAQSAQTCGIVGLLYSAFGVFFSLARGADDELNTLAAATSTGLLYKASAGLKGSLRGGAVGLGIAIAYCGYTSYPRLLEAFGRHK